MAVRKNPDGGWICELYPNGAKGKRIRKKFATKGEALAFEQYANQKPWHDEKEDRRTLKELIDIWYSSHGITLDSGTKRRRKMYYASECMGDPLARDFDAQMFSRYRERRLSGELINSNGTRTTVTAGTLNLEMSYFLAIFNELKRMGEWTQSNPMVGIRSFKYDEPEMAFLTRSQIKSLLDECKRSRNRDLYMISKLCLVTGARWSEIERLKGSQISGNKITFIKTKGRKNRTVPISPNIISQLPQLQGELFTPCYHSFGLALNRAGITLPYGQMTHVLRHTFASHFMMNGGNILVLQRILGHANIKMTMRYAHFSPDHLEDAIRLNPLAEDGD
ncbi:phage integrase [Dickeya solani]|uniref:Tyrosine-type recombinase/integrase n=1 Tax=Dickeya solani TaxID=1089444 RepID=A0ABU4EEL0_9GAMM|nr:tyrosine-type recombinase/integrase [Dickeya solani]MCA7001635.1 tyrosine-type recombinase/integrase [Dickeya solani]MDV6997011.1 tyrosine-type recombinase/integrase [Dickeya solani]MDV7002517.1 tyrosine-type recombinase/integrase [Dickeya solani]MDV7038833.1 tyrosine-type recombinase/integrase [Dickeya solani]MDV7042475.1 tyrosine-type recombinase/integrase [Dickeya solani]